MSVRSFSGRAQYGAAPAGPKAQCARRVRPRPPLPHCPPPVPPEPRCPSEPASVTDTVVDELGDVVPLQGTTVEELGEVVSPEALLPTSSRTTCRSTAPWQVSPGLPRPLRARGLTESLGRLPRASSENRPASLGRWPGPVLWPSGEAFRPLDIDDSALGERAHDLVHGARAGRVPSASECRPSGPLTTILRNKSPASTMSATEAAHGGQG
jgi:hypothetical protein